MAHKIIAALRDAVAGKVARATVYRGGVPVQRYTVCRGCGGLTLTVNRLCDCCGDRKFDVAAPSDQGETR